MSEKVPVPMFTANTMASAIEAMGMSYLGLHLYLQLTIEIWLLLMKLVNICTRCWRRNQAKRYYDRDAFENALGLVLAMGGSTNAVLHLLAITREAEVELTIDDFDKFSRETPYLTDLRPGGKYAV